MHQQWRRQSTIIQRDCNFGVQRTHTTLLVHDTPNYTNSSYLDLVGISFEIMKSTRRLLNQLRSRQSIMMSRRVFWASDPVGHQQVLEG